MKRKFRFRAVFFLLFLVFGCKERSEPPQTTTPNPPQTSTPNPPQDSLPTLPFNPPPVHFFTFGDWGTDDVTVPPQKNQLAVALQAQGICETQNCDFGLFLGDNFYPTGVSDVNDPQWQTKYQNVYGVHPALRIPLYAVLGNHDWDSGVSRAQAQVDFDLQDQDPWWRMPEFYYSFQFPDGGEPVVEVFVVNSNNFASDTLQQDWLSQTLAASNASWKIVAMHHPTLSNGPHPPDEKNNYLLSDGTDGPLKRIICGKVDLLLAGHNHLFSHLRATDGCGYDQLIVGTGGKFLYNPTLSPPELVFTESCFGVVYFEIDPTQLSLTFFPVTDPSAGLCLDGTQGTSYTYTRQKP